MASDKLRIYKRPAMSSARLLLGFSGWMDGGEVSTGTIQYLIEKLDAEKLAEIDPEGFYLYNFPGPMEMTSIFRPHTKIKDGVIAACDMPSNWFYCSENSNLLLFLGKEPHLQWREFASCIFTVCTEFKVEMIYFIGSVAGLVPHTREPRLFCSVSDMEMKETFRHYGVKFSNYEGPSGFSTYLTATARDHGVGMVSLVAAIPAYVQGNNPRCIETVTRRLSGMLGLQIEFEDLREISDEFEKRLGEIVQEQPELTTNIRKLEEDYDNEIFNNEMGDLKKWLEQQGIRLD